MDNLLRDIIRLDLLGGTIFAEERLSPVLLVKDFTHYYFSRFVLNLKHTFSTFTTDQLSDFNRRHDRALKAFFHKKALSHPSTIIFIPKGMVDGYKATLDQLIQVLLEINAESLVPDLTALTSIVENKGTTSTDIHPIDRRQFDHLKSVIARQFSPVGLHNSTASQACGTVDDIAYVNQQLLRVIATHYPSIFKTEGLLKQLDHLFSQDHMEASFRQEMSFPLLNLAYRLSLFAVVMGHIQEMEYNFVKSIDILLKTELA